jgi:hypothetical protein
VLNGAHWASPAWSAAGPSHRRSGGHRSAGAAQLLVDRQAPAVAAFLDAERALMAHHGLEATDTSATT